MIDMVSLQLLIEVFSIGPEEATETVNEMIGERERWFRGRGTLFFGGVAGAWIS